MTTEIIILGTGGNCLDILDIIGDINSRAGTERYRCAGFLDDDARNHGRELRGVKVLGPLSAAAGFPQARFVNGIGSPRTFRKKAGIIAGAGIPDARFETLVHPSAAVSAAAALGEGTVVFPHVAIGSGAKVGRHVIILPGGVVSHDAVIGDYACLATGACVSGAATVGRACYLGARSVLKEGLSVGAGSLIGMGSVVLKDVEEGSVMAGNPARCLRKEKFPP